MILYKLKQYVIILKIYLKYFREMLACQEGLCSTELCVFRVLSDSPTYK
jgi:hypothetical protein